MKKKLPQTPDAFEADLRRLIRMLGYLAHEYRWAYGIAYSQQVMDTVPARTRRHMTQPDELEGEAKRVMMEHRSIREAMKEVSDSVDRIRASMRKDERRHGELFDPLLFPVTVSKIELEDLGESKMRRRMRGEWSPL